MADEKEPKPGDPTPASGPQPEGNDGKEQKEITKVTPPKEAFSTSEMASLAGGPVTSAGSGLRMRRSSGSAENASNIKGDYSAADRRVKVTNVGSRTEKLTGDIVTIFNDVAAQTTLVNIDAIPDEHDLDQPVAHNGVYNNAHAISQRGSGGSPADRTFYRELGLVKYDRIYPVDGQYNFDNDTLRDLVIKDNDPSKDLDSAARMKTLHKGNWLQRAVKVTFKNGRVIDIQFFEEDLSNNNITEEVKRRGSNAALRAFNRNYKDYLALVEKSRESISMTDYKCPLASRVIQPQDTLDVIRSIDLDIGDMMLAAALKLKQAGAYQGWKVLKDGQRQDACIHEMLKMDVPGTTFRHASGTDSGNIDQVFKSKSANARGNAALAILFRDSSYKKYRTKGTCLFHRVGGLLNNIKTFTDNLDTKDYLKKLHCHKAFYEDLKRHELFGFFIGNESDITPPFLCDGIGVETTLSLEECLPFQHGGHTPLDADKPLFVMAYGELHGVEYSYVYNYLISGLIKYFNKHADVLNDSSYFNIDGNGEHSITIPMTNTVMGFSLWDLILASASTDIIESRAKALNMINEIQKYYNYYPFSNGIEINSEMLDMPNVKITSVKLSKEENESRQSALLTTLAPVSVSPTEYPDVIAPEVFEAKAYKDADAGVSGTSSNHFVMATKLPWYFSVVGLMSKKINGKGNKWYLKPGDSAHMTYFMVRGGIRYIYLEELVKMDPEALRLRMNIMVDIPGRDKVCVQDEYYKTIANRYSPHDDGIPLMNYFVAPSSGDPDLEKIFTVRDFLRTPRELGTSFIAPAGVVTPKYDDEAHTSAIFGEQAADTCQYVDLDDSYLIESGPSFVTYMWHSSDDVANELFDVTINRDLGVNQKAKYDAYACTPESADADVGFYFTPNTGKKMDTNELIHPYTIVEEGDGEFDPETGMSQESNEVYDKLGEFSTLKADYIRIQFFPFVINPYDCNTFKLGSTKPSKWQKINSADSWAFLQKFGLCGFVDGEYGASVNKRVKQMNESGIEFIDDPYIEARG